MKKLITLVIASAMLLAVTSCGDKDAKDPAETTTAQTTVVTGESETAEGTVGETLLADFKTMADKSAQDIADALIQNPVIAFMPATMPVEEGFLNGFNEEIKGFKEGVMFGPAIGTIPFVGYIFTLEDGADVDGFKTTLKDNANLRWNICTAAEEMVCENVGNTVFFVMCPTAFEEAPAEDEGNIADDGIADDGIGGMDMPAADGDMPAFDGEMDVPAAEDGITLE